MRLQDIIERMEKEFEDVKQMIGIKKLPSCDIIERENEIEILIDLPGFTKKDVDVELGEDYVKVRAERKKERKEGQYVVNERVLSFYRNISLPCRIDVEKAKAKMRNGVLEIMAPTIRKAGKKIKIE